MAGEYMECAFLFDASRLLIGHEDPVKASVVIAVAVIGREKWLLTIDCHIRSDREVLAE